ncbi:polysaccharide biosynthesis protein [Ilyomonas limi]|uniref:Polysaccharide biosynthesis protein n=1 Tax=Ilyomonas limi TaxID=2575867 RepID=A0A4U3KVG4_9BACT|nr:nucleoside-diphosphate sugar epimerase/dehydratase [Ilyomonas limi]TKK65016.1 polysaccharide biosynthesis protein [Ilyomonas limi]
MDRIVLHTKVIPRWVVLLIDLAVCSLSFGVSYFLVKHFEFTFILRGHFFFYTISYVLLTGIVFYCMKVHTCLIRYSNIHDMLRIFLAVLVTSLLYPLVNKLLLVNYFDIRSLNVLLALSINFFITSSLLIMLRVSVKEMFLYGTKASESSKEQVLIFGSGKNAILIKQAIEASKENAFVIAGFIDTNTKRINTVIEQKKVHSIRELSVLKYRKNITKLILHAEQTRGFDKKNLLERCLELGIQVLTVPPSDEWVYGKLSLNQMQALRIEDLLQREPIVINNTRISEELFNKRVLITGAAGSIGSEIVKQVLSFKPEMVILCDQAESSLHEMQLHMQDMFPQAVIQVFIGNVREFARMQIPFKEYKPHIVFHAAAYKHVPMMENHPSEAVLTNILGTKNIADLAAAYGAEKFVMISTDKAVNPTNVMGTSKRIAEMYVQLLSSTPQLIDNTTLKTKFITTRFGNVLGSSGSVIPRFKEQIQKGGPVTVTHPEITRFFMTIPEAVQLVLEACTMGTGGEIYIFDMGKPVKIADLARKMIQLAGLTPDQDIRVAFTGLRPGEKLYEELLNKEELTLPTYHEKIKIARVMPNHRRVRYDIETLIKMCSIAGSEELVRKMKTLVPEYKSKNSRFEKLDVELEAGITETTITAGV